jgi:hypothetical protein
MRAVEMYREAPLGTSKVFFCHEELGKSSTETSASSSREELRKSSTEEAVTSREETKSSYLQRLALTKNFVNGHA